MTVDKEEKGNIVIVTMSGCNITDTPANINNTTSDAARIKAKLLVKLINYLSFELGYPKEELVKIIKQIIEKGDL